MFKKSPHFGDKRSKVDIELHINYLKFTTNDYFLRNSYYTIYFKGHKNNKLKSRTITRTLEDLLSQPIPVDSSLKCTATLFQDHLHVKYLNGKLKDKFKKLVIRQMTKLRSGEVLYRDVGYVLLPLHTFVQHPDKIDSRLPITHPINKIDAFLDCSITVRVDAFLSQLPNVVRPINKKLSRTLSQIGISDDKVPKRSKYTLCVLCY